MMDKSMKNKKMMVIVVGLVVLLLGVFTQLYSATIGVVLGVIIWVVGMVMMKKMGGKNDGGMPQNPPAGGNNM